MLAGRDVAREEALLVRDELLRLRRVRVLQPAVRVSHKRAVVVIHDVVAAQLRVRGRVAGAVPRREQRGGGRHGELEQRAWTQKGRASGPGHVSYNAAATMVRKSARTEAAAALAAAMRFDEELGRWPSGYLIPIAATGWFRAMLVTATARQGTDHSQMHSARKAGRGRGRAPGSAPSRGIQAFRTALAQVSEAPSSRSRAAWGGGGPAISSLLRKSREMLSRKTRMETTLNSWKKARVE